MFTEMNGLPLLHCQYNQYKYLPSNRYLYNANTNTNTKTKTNTNTNTNNINTNTIPIQY